MKRTLLVLQLALSALCIIPSCSFVPIADRGNHRLFERPTTALSHFSSMVNSNGNSNNVGNDYDSSATAIGDRRDAIRKVLASSAIAAFCTCLHPTAAIASIDVNNALAREYTAFPGLYPTIATKIVNAAKNEEFQSKQQVYDILNELEQDRLRQYDAAIVIAPLDKNVQQFKTSQICKYECGGRVSSNFRDEQIKAIQTDRR